MLLLFFFLISSAAIARPKVSLVANKVNVDIEDYLRVVLRVESSTGQVGQPVFPVNFARGFQVASRNPISGFSYTNGRRIFVYNYTLVMIAATAGKYKLGPVSIDVNGTTYQSNSLKVTVRPKTRSHAQNQNRLNPIGPGGRIMPGQPSIPQVNPRTQPKQNQPHVWIDSKVSKKEVYVGEVIDHDYRFYATVPTSFDHPVFPELDGFFSKRSFLKPSREITLKDGRRASLVHFRYTLVPLKPGEYTLPAINMEILMRVYAQTQLGFTSFQTTQQKTLKSKPIKLKVKPLPKPIPQGFTNWVGQFNFVAGFSTTKVKDAEPIRFEVTLSGRGNLNQGSLLGLEWPEGLSVFEEETKYTYEGGIDFGAKGKKSFSYTLIAKEPGAYTIAEQEFYYFDPEKKEYQKMVLPETTLVFGDPNQNKTKPKPAIQPKIKEQKQTAKELELQQKQKSFSVKFYFWILAGLIFTTSLVVIVLQLKKPRPKKLAKPSAKKLDHSKINELNQRVRQAESPVEKAQVLLEKIDWLSKKEKPNHDRAALKEIKEEIESRLYSPTGKECTLEFIQNIQTKIKKAKN